MKLLKYKGILFDDYAEDKDDSGIIGTWAEMCDQCAQKHRVEVENDIDDGGTARGACSVYGCENSGNDAEKAHYYIDFKPEAISFVDSEETRNG